MVLAAFLSESRNGSGRNTVLRQASSLPAWEPELGDLFHLSRRKSCLRMRHSQADRTATTTGLVLAYRSVISVHFDGISPLSDPSAGAASEFFSQGKRDRSSETAGNSAVCHPVRSTDCACLSFSPMEKPNGTGYRFFGKRTPQDLVITLTNPRPCFQILFDIS
jgi:hypothetical protein